MAVRLKHARGKVFARLLILQVFPVTLLSLMLALGSRFSDMNSGNQALLITSAAGIIVFYIVFSVLAVLKLHNPDYLVISRSGQGEWTPFFQPRELRFKPGVALVLQDSKILIAPPALATGAGGAVAPLSELPLPKTVSATADELRLIVHQPEDEEERGRRG